MVYVLDYNGKPLMPTKPSRARKLLEQKKAKVVRREPFTIKLLYQPKTTYTQPLVLGIDTGSGKIGSAVVDNNNNVIYLSEIEIRNDIADKMKQRAKYRNSKRNKKTRYRKPRWNNRKNSIKKDRFSPTMISKINSHLKEIKFAKSILPISKLIIETGNFDPHALKNPNVLLNNILYQKGANYGFANTKAFVMDRDNHTCQHCKGKTKDSKLEVHHIIFRQNGGSDEPENLITLCKTCHDNLHDGKFILKLNGKMKGNLKHATQMNSIRVQLLNKLAYAKETFGFITKENRQLLNLPKEHYVDAIVIASQGNEIQLKNNVILYKKCIADGDYQQTKGIRSEQRIPTSKIQGFRKFDKVKYNNNEYFIKGRMSTGYAILMDIHNKKIDLKPIPKFCNMERLSARSSWIIHQEIIANF